MTQILTWLEFYKRFRSNTLQKKTKKINIKINDNYLNEEPEIIKEIIIPPKEIKQTSIIKKWYSYY